MNLYILSQKLRMSHTTLANQYTQRYLALLNGTHAHFFFTRDPQGDLTYINPNILSTLGYSAEEFQSNWEQYLTTNTCNHENLRRFKSPVIEEDLNRYEFEFYHRQGKCIWLEIIEECIFNEKKEAYCLNSIAWDVTLQKSLEMGIKLREDRFREISECTPIGIFQVDPDDLYIYVNSRP